MSDAVEIPRCSLSDIVSPVDAKIAIHKNPAMPYIGLENIPSRGAILSGWEPASSSISVNSVFGAGDVLFGKLRPNLRKCVAAPFDGYCSTDILVLRPNDGFDPGFAGKILKTEEVGAEAERTSVGTKMPRTSWGNLSEFKVFCPAHPEQSKISLVLDTLDTAIQETEAIIAKLKAVKQGLLHDLLTRGIDANGELRPAQAEAPELYKMSALGWIPRDWDISQVGSQFDVQLGKMLDSERNSGISCRYLGNKSIQWDRIDVGEAQIMRLSKADMAKFRLQKGDLLVCEGGEVGRAAIWNNELSECYYQKALHRLRATQGYRPELMLEMLRHMVAKDVLSEFVSKTSIAHLTQEKLITIPLPVPVIDEQDRMVEKITAIKERIISEELGLEKLKSSKSGLMDDLLTGRVRVTALLPDPAHAEESP